MVLPGLMPHVYSSGIGIPIIEPITSNSSASNLSSYTYNNQNIGSAFSDRLVVVVTSGRQTGTPNGMTINGNNADPVAVFGNAVMGIGIYSLLVPAGTTANIVSSWSGTMSNNGIAIFSIRKLKSTTPIATPYANGSGGATNLVASTNMVPGAVGIFAANNAVEGNVNFVFSSALNVVDLNIETNHNFGVGIYTASGTETPHNETMSGWSSNWCTGVGAAWR